MTIFDYAVLCVLLLSVLLSIFRGAVRELLSLAGWVVAFIAARSLSVDLVPMIPPSIEDESLRMSVAFVAIFLAVLVAMGLIAMLLSALIKTVGLGFIDRMLGSVFGLVRGLLIVLMVVLLAGMTTLPQEPLWQKALLSKTLEKAVGLTLPWIPQELSKRINYEKKR
jgi:membrane protein required for colicin V production